VATGFQVVAQRAARLFVNNNKIQYMAFEKGQSGNPGGRPKGSGNRVTSKLRETITAFLDEKFEKVKEDFDKLKPGERIRMYIELLQFGVPKLQSVHMETDFDNLTDEQLDRIIEELKNPYHALRAAQYDEGTEATVS
jgi:hypothetical protein